LADALYKKGYGVIILDNLEKTVHKSGSWPKYLDSKKYQLIKGDVREKKDWLTALKGIDFVFHLSAYQDQRPDFHKFFLSNAVKRFC
jgi:dTDP-L-rhamnose 4-epimerase